MRAAPIAILVMCSAQIVTSQSVALTNANFEDVTGMATTSPSLVWTGVPPGWTFTPSGPPSPGQEVQIVAYVHDGAPSGGEGTAFLEGHTQAQLGTLSQSVTGLTPGATYQLSFLWGNREREGLDAFRFRVQISGQTFAATGHGFVPMTSEQLVFVANSTSTAIDITFLSPIGGVPTFTNGALDDFELTRISTGILASAADFGLGCGTPPLRLAADPTARPIIGTVGRAFLENAPSAPAAVMFGSSNTQLGPTALPIPMTFLGFDGCYLVQSANLFSMPASFIGPNLASMELAIPDDPTLVGTRVYLQGWAAAPGENDANFVLSDGLEWRFGDL